MAEVELRNVTKRWGDFTAVDNQSLAVADREFLALLGPSGCGKTTALRMIAGLEDPTSGDILIGGRVVTDDPPKDRDVAMVFQNYGLYPHMTVEENIAFPLQVRGAAKNEIAPRARAAAEKARIQALLKRKPRELSGGQRQRVALARAIVRSPQVFLMDEPLSNLDAKLRGHMRAELKHIQREIGVATAYVTHDQTEAMTLGDRVAVMESGQVAQIAPPREIYDDPATLFVAGFVGSPPMNQIRGAVSGGKFTAPGVAVAAAVSDCADAVLGVRGEDVFWAREGGDLQARVYAVEPMGDHTLSTCRAEAGEVVFKADRDFAAGEGDPIKLGFNPDRLFFFNRQDGRRLRG